MCTPMGHEKCTQQCITGYIRELTNNAQTLCGNREALLVHSAVQSQDRGWFYESRNKRTFKSQLLKNSVVKMGVW